MNIIAIVKRYERLASFIYRALHTSKFKVAKGNTINVSNCFASSCEFIIIGYGNEITIEKGMTHLKKCKFYISGNYNRVHISNGCKCKETIFHIEDDNNEIIIKPNVRITGATQLAVIEGTRIEVGQGCLFSQNITIRTGDSHSILSLESNKRINPSKNVIIKDYCWIGYSVMILKGTIINEHSIVASGAILTGETFPSNSIVGGIPGKVLKNGVDWCDKRL